MIEDHIILFSENDYGIIPLIGDDSKVDTPLPIPNREVKHFNGENSVSEDSKLPIFLLQEKLSFLRKFYFGVDFYIFNVIYLSIFQIQEWL